MSRQYQSVAKGRAQADMLRPLGITRSTASPRVVIPNPTHEQLLVIARERSHYGDQERALRTIRGVIHPNGVMIIEWRLYPSSRPFMFRSIRPNGKALYTARVNDGGFWSARSWTVVRGVNGRKPVGKQYLIPSAGLGLLLGNITPEEASSSTRGWDR